MKRLIGVVIILVLVIVLSGLFLPWPFFPYRGWSQVVALTPPQSLVSWPAAAPLGPGYAMALVVPDGERFNLAFFESGGPGYPTGARATLLQSAEPATDPRLAIDPEMNVGHLSWVESLEGYGQLWYGRFKPGEPVEHSAPITGTTEPIPAHSLALDQAGKPHLAWVENLEDGGSAVYHATIGDKGIRTQRLDQCQLMAASPAVWAGEDIYIAWTEVLLNPRRTVLMLTRLNSDGVIITQPTPIDTGAGSIRQPYLAPADRGNILAVWATDNSSQRGPFGPRPGERLIGILLDPSAKPATRPVTLARAKRPVGDQKVVRDARGYYHLVWSELGPDGWSIRYRKIKPRLKPAGPAVELSEPGLSGGRVEIVATPDGHLQVFWTNATSRGATVLSRWE